MGSVSISYKEIFAFLTRCSQDISPGSKVIISEFRLPKAITAILAGMALSVSGLQMQTIFRNPLAGPYVLGISSGASLGVALLILGFAPLFSISSIHLAGNWSMAIAAWIGAGTILFILLLVSIRIRDIMTILILGILFGSATSAIVSILQYFSNATMLKVFVIWTMGSLGAVSYNQLWVMLPSVGLGLLLAIAILKPMNMLLLGEKDARVMGVNIHKIRVLVFISTSLLAGTITAFCGPIGFIGIAVPHIARMLFKTADHRVLLPVTALLGSIVMLISDIISHVPGKDVILPINSVTALIGVPVVVWIIIRGTKGGRAWS